MKTIFFKVFRVLVCMEQALVKKNFQRTMAE